jgi:hypothetical protein
VWDVDLQPALLSTAERILWIADEAPVLKQETACWFMLHFCLKG